MPPGTYIHKLSNVDRETKTADCAKCGKGIDIRIRQSGRVSCRIAIREEKAKNRKPLAKRSDSERSPHHGLTRKEARDLKAEKACAICGENKTEILCVDHDHKTGVIRGVLCKKCNLGLGMFRDNPEYLATAIEYLRGEGLEGP